MEYLPPVTSQPPQLQGALKYQDPAYAAGFDAKRKDDPKRVLAKNAIKGMLADLAEKSLVLDAGCGSGLLFEFFIEKRFTVCGIDLSQALLDEAAKKLDHYKATGRLKSNFTLAVGNVCKLELADKCCDASVMCDLTRWLSPAECQQAMREFQRVAKRRIIWTARVANHPHARAVELFESALNGWKITRNEAGIDLDYRILMAEPT